MTTDTRREAVAASADIIGAKWTALLIYDLAAGTCRFRDKGRDLVPILEAMTDFGRSWLVPADALASAS